MVLLAFHVSGMPGPGSVHHSQEEVFSELTEHLYQSCSTVVGTWGCAVRSLPNGGVEDPDVGWFRLCCDMGVCSVVFPSVE